MHILKTVVLAMLVAVSVQAQPTDLVMAQQALASADAAGAQAFAKSLYEDASYRARFAQENWSSKAPSKRNEAQMRAIEATIAAEAAGAKARWLSTNAAINGLRADIQRFGGSSNITLLAEESPTIQFSRGATTRERIAAAQLAIDQAKAAGALDTVPDNDLRNGERYIDSAKRVSRSTANSEVGDHLAYRAEMIGRRAFYLARLAQSNRALPAIQLDRTRLAQAASERQASAERAQREEAERRSISLQQALAAEQASRQAQASELERLRQQIDENRRAAQARVEADSQARTAAERQLDESYGRYATAIATSAPSDVETLRLQIEDQELSLRAIQDRERANAEAMQAGITRLRGDLTAAQQSGAISPEVISQRQADLLARQAELDSLRQSLESDTAARSDRARQQHEAVTAAQARRQQADAEAAALRQKAEDAERQAQAAQAEAQQANAQAQQAQAAAEQAQAQAQQTQSQLDQTKAAAQQTQSQLDQTKAAAQQTQSQLDQAQAAAQQTQSQLDQTKAAAQQTQSQLDQTKAAAQQTQSQLDQAQAAAQQTQAQLDQTKQLLAERDAEARMLRVQNELARIASTRSEQRGIIVTLSGGILFDTGKTSLKPGAKSTLTKIARQLQTDPSLKIAVDGHTDNVGKAAKNQALSEKRANAVRDYLVSAGIDPDHITATGRGEEAPVATNKTAAGRQQNRRVELVITQ